MLSKIKQEVTILLIIYTTRQGLFHSNRTLGLFHSKKTLKSFPIKTIFYKGSLFQSENSFIQSFSLQIYSKSFPIKKYIFQRKIDGHQYIQVFSAPNTFTFILKAVFFTSQIFRVFFTLKSINQFSKRTVMSSNKNHIFAFEKRASLFLYSPCWL